MLGPGRIGQCPQVGRALTSTPPPEIWGLQRGCLGARRQLPGAGGLGSVYWDGPGGVLVTLLPYAPLLCP